MSTSKPHSGRLAAALEEARQLCARSDTFRDYPEFKLARALLELEERFDASQAALQQAHDYIEQWGDLPQGRLVLDVVRRALSNPASELEETPLQRLRREDPEAWMGGVGYPDP